MSEPKFKAEKKKKKKIQKAKQKANRGTDYANRESFRYFTKFTVSHTLTLTFSSTQYSSPSLSLSFFLSLKKKKIKKYTLTRTETQTFRLAVVMQWRKPILPITPHGNTITHRLTTRVDLTLLSPIPALFNTLAVPGGPVFRRTTVSIVLLAPPPLPSAANSLSTSLPTAVALDAPMLTPLSPNASSRRTLTRRCKPEEEESGCFSLKRPTPFRPWSVSGTRDSKAFTATCLASHATIRTPIPPPESSRTGSEPYSPTA